jgi:multiple sugar transport system substrate-binding protein
MKLFFAIVLACVAALFAGMVATLPPKTQALRWSTDRNPARDRQAEEFGRMYGGDSVIPDPGDRAKLIVQCATGIGPDLIDIYHAQDMATLVDAGVLLDLTPYAGSMGFGVDKTYPAVRDALMIDGRQYRFPCNVWASCVVYNSRIFAELNVPEPSDDWTWDDFIATGKLIRERSGGRTLAVANWESTFVVKDLLIANGGRMYSADGLHSELASPAAIAAMQRYYDMMHVHKILPTPAEAAAMSSQGGWGSGSITWFSTRKAAMIMLGRWYSVQVPNYPGLGKELSAVLLPRVPGQPLRGVVDSRACGVNAHLPPQRREQALKFLQYLASENYGRIIVNDGDALPPNPDLARDGVALVNAGVPNPRFHQAFIDAMKYARPRDISPFIESGPADRWLKERIEQVENLDPSKVDGPAEVRRIMQSLAREIDYQIRVNLERRDSLQKRYEKVTGRPYTPEWWKT